MYDVLARLVYGSSLQRAQQALLPFIQEHDRVLIIGGGSGWLLEQVLVSCPGLQVLYLEASPKMLQLAKHRFQQLNAPGATVAFRLGTEAALERTEVFDKVVTPFLLDLFPPQRLRPLMERLARHLAPEGLWLFADFWPVATPPPWWQRFLIRSMYAFFGTISNVQASTLPVYQDHFKKLQLQEVYTKPFFKGMVQAKVFRREAQRKT
ncbi:class I SAM-dependent methyltransferase [Pontibacter beigongshangensis]|uniref:class I SAM-dependent methyltransferase n=1 Tax=Pontibacter beigongshangensis TaxID=2574733 RepID=UPI00293BCEF0|nr:class I SAM-dependent methyltransferase [Pontibacter beigongshangensis]